MELLTEETGSHEVFSDCVNLTLHFEVLRLDTHVVSLVYLIKNFYRFKRCLCNILIDFWNFSVKYNFDLFQFNKEDFQISFLLFLDKSWSINLFDKLLTIGVWKKHCFVSGHKLVECSSWLDETDFTFKSKIRHIIGQYNLSKCSCESSRLKRKDLVLKP